ncbi:hypothetical protein L596_009174 [Steinernema carpocapsae]|uniref:protein-serine/threonine phosphatase n=1 Tax=Steinernema carpocapsae TaxID=34508 RepID=A0A4U5PES6_STECR|nr:hypothetical protein L596_009174 [Steinernema carpocapsae]
MLRHNHKRFLEVLSEYFEMHLFTLRTRRYAQAVIEHLDPEGRFFGDRLVSREEIPDGDKFEVMKKAFPDGHEHVVAVDDSKEIWHDMPNLVLIRSFDFFQDPRFVLVGGPARCFPCRRDDYLIGTAHQLIHVHRKFFDYHDKDERKSTAELFVKIMRDLEVIERAAAMFRELVQDEDQFWSLIFKQLKDNVV